MMMIPRKNFDLFDDFFEEPFFRKNENTLMKTDIRENDKNYIIDVDLPGYTKDNIKIDVTDGYLNINAKVENKNDEEEKGKFVRRERFYGECSRSFYIGEDVETDDIKASFKNGILSLEVPKVPEDKKQPEKKYIEIK